MAASGYSDAKMLKGVANISAMESSSSNVQFRMSLHSML